MVWLFTQSDLERAILCDNRLGVIPLEITCLPVMKVDSLPIWVITRIESATIDIELVREY
jgi:hypothetical protein